MIINLHKMLLWNSKIWSEMRFILLFQIKGMKERLDFWCGDVKNMAMLVEEKAQDILTWSRSPPVPPVHLGKVVFHHKSFCIHLILFITNL